MQNRHVIIIGAGIGGLASACLLATRGYRVTVLEKNRTAGGKMQEYRKDGYRFDCGPSLLTMPFLLEKLYEECGFRMENHLSISELTPLCRYSYPDGTLFNSWSDPLKTREEIRRFAPDDEENYSRFLEYSAELYRMTAAPFIYNPLYGPRDLPLSKLGDFLKINPFSTVAGKVDRSFRSDYLRKFFKRFATYNGSSPYQAPATLNVIPHTELTLGGYYVYGGMFRIAESLFEMAENLGVRFLFESEAEQISVSRNTVTDCILTDGTRLPCDLIFSNADSAETILKLLPRNAVPPLEQHRRRSLEPSSSGFVILAAVKKQWPRLSHHNIFFSEDYEEEFTDIFRRRVLPRDPTLYVTSSSLTDPADAPQGCSNLFILVIAPCVDEKQNWDEITRSYPDKVFEKLEQNGLQGLRRNLQFFEVFNPLHFKETYQANRGAIYGSSSNRISSAFIRPRNKFRPLHNLYMVGGSTHPGGGIPLVLQSAFNAVRLLERGV